MKPLLVILGIVVACAIAGGIVKSMKAPAPGSNSASDCELPGDIHPSELLGMATSRKEEIRTAYSSMVGCRVPQGGWEGQLTETDGKILRFEYGSGISSYSIRVVMRDATEVRPGSTMRFRGRLDAVTSTIVMANVINRIDLSDGEIVEN